VYTLNSGRFSSIDTVVIGPGSHQSRQTFILAPWGEPITVEVSISCGEQQTQGGIACSSRTRAPLAPLRGIGERGQKRQRSDSGNDYPSAADTDAQEMSSARGL
jgi:hypothetical protein